jgi:hypothetical protein
MKEDLMMQKEIAEKEDGGQEVRVLIHEYNFNDINRHILSRPIVQMVMPEAMNRISLNSEQREDFSNSLQIQP